MVQAYPSPTYMQRLKIAFHYLLPQYALTRLAGWFAERRFGQLTHFAIARFAKAYGVDWSEAEKTRPADYASFNEFFIRRLAEGKRPLAEGEGVLCLPADGRVSECGTIEGSRLLQAKGHFFTLESLLAGDRETAAQFADGWFLTTYLSPRDYHRVHMPCRGVLRKMVYVPGDLFSVNPFLAEHVPNLFARNERVICLFDTDFGPMVQILVGATVTASISTVWAGVVNPPRGKEVRVSEYPVQGDGSVVLERGQEMGAFRLGSTVINLFVKDALVPDGRLQAGAVTRMGERMGEARRAV